jgi:hypothetical protein
MDKVIGLKTNGWAARESRPTWRWCWQSAERLQQAGVKPGNIWCGTATPAILRLAD